MKIYNSQFLYRDGYSILLEVNKYKVAGRNVYKVINYLEHHNTFTSLSPLL